MLLEQYHLNLSQKHLLAVKGVLCYLSKMCNYAIEYNFSRTPPNSSIQMILLTDFNIVNADCASDFTDCQSILGYAFFIFSSLVSWSSVKQQTVALLLTEAKYMSIAHAMQVAI